MAKSFGVFFKQIYNCDVLNNVVHTCFKVHLKAELIWQNLGSCDMSFILTNLFIYLFIYLYTNALGIKLFIKLLDPKLYNKFGFI